MGFNRSVFSNGLIHTLPAAQSFQLEVRGPDNLKGIDALRSVTDSAELFLDIENAQDAAACLKKLGELPELMSLRISVDRITDDDLRALAQLKSLQRLSLDCAELTEQELGRLHVLKSLKKLQELLVVVIPGTTGNALNDLRSAFPEVNVSVVPLDLSTRLGRYGIQLGEVEGGAVIELTHRRSLQMMDILRRVKPLTRVQVTVAFAKDVQACLDKLKPLSDMAELRIGAERLSETELNLLAQLKQVKQLQISVESMTEKELSQLSAFAHLEGLSLVYLDITEKEVAQLHALKSLKKLRSFHLAHLRLTTKTLAELEEALGQVKIVTFEQGEAIRPLYIAPNDSPLVRLRKEKFNVVAKELLLILQSRHSGRCFNSTPLWHDSMRRYRDAALEIDDPRLKMRVVNDYVALMERIDKDTERLYKIGHERDTPGAYFRVRYEYLQAQILQLELRKEMQSGGMNDKKNP
jgi:hypothetical protein